MLIKTQDNRTIINMNDVNRLSIGDNYIHGKAIIYAHFNSERIEIGCYESSERAVSVLNSISMKYEEIERSRFFGMEEAKFEIPTFNMPLE